MTLDASRLSQVHALVLTVTFVLASQENVYALAILNSTFTIPIVPALHVKLVSI
jgi:hypothetical protein